MLAALRDWRFWVILAAMILIVGKYAWFLIDYFFHVKPRDY